jgi:protocatechuate 3,4-dioxygenase beta subunit
MGLGGLFYAARGAFAQALRLTPSQVLGPYYPNRMPLDQDNDLLVLGDSLTPAVGAISWISGRILDRNGQPVRGALVEIWQADNNGAYIHTSSPIANRDPGFQGYGRFLTASNGEYLFRTVKPGLYPGRTRHVHFAVTAPGAARFITQLYVEGESLNTNDGELGRVTPALRSLLVVPWSPVAGSRTGDLAARFDIVLGYTPAENANAARPTMVSMVNGASYHEGAASAAWVTIFGQNLASSARGLSASDVVNGRLPEMLDGVSVRINNQPAALHYISPTQINVQAPSATGNGPVQVTVTNGNGTSDPLTINLASLMPAFFPFPEEYVAAVRADGVYIAPSGLLEGTASVAARPGDQVSLYGTGFGPTVPEIPAGRTVSSAAPLAVPVVIRFDTQIVDVSFAGLSGPGLYQFNVTVPDLPDGDHAVTAEPGGVRTAKIGRIRIERQTTANVAPPGATPASPRTPSLQGLPKYSSRLPQLVTRHTTQA